MRDGPEMTYQFDGLLCSVFSAERDERVASVQAAERVHHQAKVPDRTGLLEQRDQLIFKQVSWDLANEYLPGRKRYDSIIGRFGTQAGVVLACVRSGLSG